MLQYTYIGITGDRGGSERYPAPWRHSRSPGEAENYGGREVPADFRSVVRRQQEPGPLHATRCGPDLRVPNSVGGQEVPRPGARTGVTSAQRHHRTRVWIQGRSSQDTLCFIRKSSRRNLHWKFRNRVHSNRSQEIPVLGTSDI